MVRASKKDRPRLGEIDALSDAALRLIAAIEPGTPPWQALQFRRRAARLIELADRMERDGAAIMTDQPSLPAAFASRDRSPSLDPGHIAGVRRQRSAGSGSDGPARTARSRTD
jgi:hypothetical protein